MTQLYDELQLKRPRAGLGWPAQTIVCRTLGPMTERAQLRKRQIDALVLC